MTPKLLSIFYPHLYPNPPHTPPKLSSTTQRTKSDLKNSPLNIWKKRKKKKKIFENERFAYKGIKQNKHKNKKDNRPSQMKKKKKKKKKKKNYSYKQKVSGLVVFQACVFFFFVFFLFCFFVHKKLLNDWNTVTNFLIKLSITVVLHINNMIRVCTHGKDRTIFWLWFFCVRNNNNNKTIIMIFLRKKMTAFNNLTTFKALNEPKYQLKFGQLGPVVQSVVSLTSSLRVISLTVLADSIYNILIFFAEKMWVAFALQKLLTFFQQKISAYLRITRCKF